MRRLIFLPDARRDLIQIQNYLATESGSLVVALAFIATLRRQCRKLAELPGTLGRARPELRPDLRGVTHRGYLILFRYDAARLEIVTIVEGHRDVEAIFGSE